MCACVCYVEEKGVIRFNFQVESSQVHGGKKQLLVNSMLIHAETAKLSCRLPGSFSTESSSPIPGVHMYLYTWWPLTTLSFEKYDRSPAIDKTLITAQCNKFSLFNASLD